MTDTLCDGRPTVRLATWDEADALLTTAKNDGTIEFERRAINHSAQAAKRDVPNSTETMYFSRRVIHFCINAVKVAYSIRMSAVRFCSHLLEGSY